MTLIAPYSETMRFSPNTGIEIIPREPPKVRKPSRLKVLCHKVAEFIKKLWKTLSFWKIHSNFRLTKRQIRLIQEVKRNRGLRERKVEPLVAEDRGRDSARTEGIPPRTHTPCEPIDPTLLHLCEFLGSFSQVLVQDFFKEKIEHSLPETKDSYIEKVDALNDWVGHVVNFRDAVLPFLSKFSKIENSLATVVIQQIMQATLQAAGNEKTAREKIESILKDNINKLKDTKEITEDEYEQILSLIQPTLNWIFNSNNWLIHSRHPKQLHDLLVNTVAFVDTLKRLLDDHTLDPLLGKIKTQIGETFETDVKDFLDMNTKPIAAHLSYRLSELLTNLPFSTTFNELLEVAFNQTEGWHKANSVQQKLEQAITDANNDVQHRAPGVKEVDKQRAAQELMDIIEKDGGEKAFLKKEFHRTFSEHTACHSDIRILIEEENPKNGERLHEEICDKIAEKLLLYLLPSEGTALPDGGTIAFKGISTPLNKLVLPGNFEKLKGWGLEIFRTVMDEGNFNDKKNFEKYFFIIGKFIAIEFIQKQVQKAITAGLLKIKTKLSSKEYLDELAAELLLPALIEKIFEVWTRSTMELNTDLIAPFFHKMIESKDVLEGNQELLDTLHTLMKKAVIDFKLEKAGIGKEKFKTIVQPIITEIFTNLMLALKKEDPVKSHTEKEIKAHLKEYFKTNPVPVNDIYGKLTMNALFRIGNFGGTWTETILGWLQKRISKSCSIAMHDVSKDYVIFVSSTVEAASQTLLSPGKVRELFFDPEPGPEAVEKKQREIKGKLLSNIKIISTLIHDTLYRSLESGTGGFFTKHAIPKSTKLEGLITDIYHKLFSRPLLNNNLLMRAVDVVDRSLGKAVENMEARAEQSHKIEEISSPPQKVA